MANEVFDIATIIEEAYEQAGIESRTGHDIQTARRSMALLNIEWASKGINFWTIDEIAIPMVPGQTRYDLPADTLDVFEAVASQGGRDIPVPKQPMVAYARTARKDQTGTIPSFITIDKQKTAPSMIVWPVPDTEYYMTIFRIRRIADPANNGAELDVRWTFIPAYIAALAAKLAQKSKDRAVRADSAGLQAIADQKFEEASYEDRDKSTFFWRPYVGDL
jgi:hypothetical protein